MLFTSLPFASFLLSKLQKKYMHALYNAVSQNIVISALIEVTPKLMYMMILQIPNNELLKFYEGCIFFRSFTLYILSI